MQREASSSGVTLLRLNNLRETTPTALAPSLSASLLTLRIEQFGVSFIPFLFLDVFLLLFFSRRLTSHLHPLPQRFPGSHDVVGEAL
jgi:hypothetical protein